MNNERRKRLVGLVGDLTKLKEEVETAGEITDDEELANKEEGWSSQLEDVNTSLEELRDEEQDYLDNMPESFKDGDKGSNAQTAIDAMDEGLGLLDEMLNVTEVGELHKMIVEKCESTCAHIEDAGA